MLRGGRVGHKSRVHSGIWHILINWLYILDILSLWDSFGWVEFTFSMSLSFSLGHRVPYPECTSTEAGERSAAEEYKTFRGYERLAQFCNPLYKSFPLFNCLYGFWNKTLAVGPKRILCFFPPFYQNVLFFFYVLQPGSAQHKPCGSVSVPWDNSKYLCLALSHIFVGLPLAHPGTSESEGRNGRMPASALLLNLDSEALLGEGASFSGLPQLVSHCVGSICVRMGGQMSCILLQSRDKIGGGQKTDWRKESEGYRYL